MIAEDGGRKRRRENTPIVGWRTFDEGQSLWNSVLYLYISCLVWPDVRHTDRVDDVLTLYHGCRSNLRDDEIGIRSVLLIVILWVIDPVGLTSWILCIDERVFDITVIDAILTLGLRELLVGIVCIATAEVCRVIDCSIVIVITPVTTDR